MFFLSENITLKRWIVILTVTAALMALGVQWWLPPLLAFLGASNNITQQIRLLPYLLYLLSLLFIILPILFVGLWNWSKPESGIAPQTETPNSKPDPQDDNKLSTVRWDARDAQLLRYYFELCAEHDEFFRQHAEGDQKQILDYFLANGLAGKAQDRKIYLTLAGLLLCCRRDLIPRHTFHVQVNFSYGDLRKQLFGSVLYLYKELIELLRPIFERRLGSPDIRDQFGSEKLFFDYPPIAVREALINFLIHRDYFQYDVGYIVVSSDKIEFINPGESEYLPETLLKLERPLDPRSQRNPTLIAAINKSGLNQSRGHGILSIKQELRQNKSLFPNGKVALQIQNDVTTNRFVLTIYKRPPYFKSDGLGDKAQRLAFQAALAGAYTTLADTHPQWAAALFDGHFLQNRAAPLLARCLTRANQPEPTELATAWADQMNPTDSAREHRITELTPVASDFLGWFEDELRARSEFQPLFDSRALDTTAAAVKNLEQELSQLLAQIRIPRQRALAWPLSARALPRPASDQANSPEPEVTIVSQDGQPVVGDDVLSASLPELNPNLLEHLTVPVGAVNLRDGFYVQREADYHLKHQLPKMGGTLTTIRASRQTGKTSLLVRGIHDARQNGIKVVHLDLQSVERKLFEKYNRFLRYLAEYIVWALKLDLHKVEEAWRGPFGPQDKLTILLEEYVLAQSDKPILLAMDEADRLLYTDFHTDFFALIRSWHNNRAVDEQWRKLNIVLLISTEPHLLIADHNRSPFNVGLKINLEDFNQEQVRDLNERHASPVTEEELPQLMALLGGHPYLTRQALYTLVTKSLSWAELRRIALSDEGPFAEHLRRYYRLLYDQPALKAALREVIEQNRCSDEMILYRLLRAGLVKGSRDSCTCRCELYRMYFKDKL